MACASDRAEAEGAEGVQRKKKGGKRIQGPVCKTQKLQGPCGNLIFPTDLGVV
jgi:hypothetical protein